MVQDLLHPRSALAYLAIAMRVLRLDADLADAEEREKPHAGRPEFGFGFFCLGI